VLSNQRVYQYAALVSSGALAGPSSFPSRWEACAINDKKNKKKKKKDKIMICWVYSVIILLEPFSRVFFGPVDYFMICWCKRKRI